MDDPSVEERFRATMQKLETDRKNPELLIAAGDIAEQLGRKSEAWIFWTRALEADDTLHFLVERLRRVADPDQLKEVERLAVRPRTYREALKGVWRYPVTGIGLGATLCGTFFLTVYAVGVWFVPPAALLAVLITPYMTLFYMDVLRQSAFGSDDVPHWPDQMDFITLFRGWFRILGAGVACVWLPILAGSAITWFYFGTRSPGWAYVPVALSCVLSALYLPVAILANYVFDSSGTAFRYILLVRSIVGTWRSYRLCFAISMGCIGLSLLGGILARPTLLYLVTIPLFVFLELYGSMLMMRVLGLFYRHHRQKLNWINQDSA